MITQRHFLKLILIYVDLCRVTMFFNPLLIVLVDHGKQRYR